MPRYISPGTTWLFYSYSIAASSKNSFPIIKSADEMNFALEIERQLHKSDEKQDTRDE
jgi:hypothetical protein